VAKAVGYNRSALAFARQRAGESTVSETNQEPKRETILVVDDEAEVRALVREILTQHGYTVIDTGDPFEARRIAEAQPINLLLTDVVMPIMNGLELAQRVEASSPTTKVLLMSGYATASVKGSGRPLVAKPFRSSDLVNAVRQMLDSRSAFRRPGTPPASKPGFGPI
jgi:CheY-like chemotaxis protein